MNYLALCPIWTWLTGSLALLAQSWVTKLCTQEEPGANSGEKGGLQLLPELVFGKHSCSPPMFNVVMCFTSTAGWTRSGGGVQRLCSYSVTLSNVWFRHQQRQREVFVRRIVFFTSSALIGCCLLKGAWTFNLVISDPPFKYQQMVGPWANLAARYSHDSRVKLWTGCHSLTAYRACFSASVCLTHFSYRLFFFFCLFQSAFII